MSHFIKLCLKSISSHSESLSGGQKNFFLQKCPKRGVKPDVTFVTFLGPLGPLVLALYVCLSVCNTHSSLTQIHCLSEHKELNSTADL